MKSSKKLKIYAEKNEYYSNYLRVQLLCKHLPYEVTYFTEFNPNVALENDIVYFQSYWLYRYFVPGPKYVWDLDDVIESKECNTERSRAYREIEVGRCFKSVDFVIFGSELLKEHYKDWYKCKSTVMIDYIDPCDHEATNQKINDGKIRIGFHGTDYYDVEINDLLPVMQKLKEKYPIEFIVIGVNTAHNEIEEAGFTHIRQVPYEQFPYALAAQGLDIGVAYYRQDKEVNLPKNHLKFSEYAWLGIPCVASEWILGQFVPKDYFAPIKDINDMYEAIESLIKGKELKDYKKFVEDNFSLHQIVPKYIKLFGGICEY